MSDTLIRDNKDYGSVGEFLRDVVKEGSELSVVSAYFTIFAYYGLHEQLDTIKSMKFLFGEPTFVTSDNVDVRNYKIEDESIVINPTEKFGQKRIASKCADWIRNKVEIKSIVKPNFLHGKMYYTERHIQDISEVKAISGSSNFTTSGLGLKDKANNIELNLIVDSDHQKDELKGWFDKIWNDETGLVQDVKEEVLKYLELLYKENEPELVYFKTYNNNNKVPDDKIQFASIPNKAKYETIKYTLKKEYDIKSNLDWKKFFGKDYDLATLLVYNAQLSKDINKTAWLNLTDSFNDLMIRTFIEKLKEKCPPSNQWPSTINRKSELVDIGVLLKQSSYFTNTYTQCADFLKLHERRSSDLLSHANNKKSLKPNTFVSSREKGTLLKIYKPALQSLILEIEKII